MIYTGIGSRETPFQILRVMTEVARRLDKKGHTLRSGGAQGADSAFARGSSNSVVWNPRAGMVVENEWAVKAAEKLCWEFPLNRMKPFTRNLIIRNMYQVLGESGDQASEFVILWTPTLDPTDKDGGGTRYAARLAKERGIKIYNLRDEAILNRFVNRLKECAEKNDAS